VKSTARLQARWKRSETFPVVCDRATIQQKTVEALHAATRVAIDQPVRIVIAGEHPIFRHGLRRLLEVDPRYFIVCETGDGAAAISLVQELEPDILLLGLATSGRPAVDTVRELAETQSRVRTIILTDRVDTPEVTAALQLGARGVVPKDSTPEILFKSIRSVMAGHFWLGREQVSGAVPGLRKLEASRRAAKAFGLTRRELDILRAVVAGYTNREIAERTAISENTVKSHITHIFNKSGASSRVELALFAAHHRLLDGV
jgi:two-component system, NarL family, nitrate/nitrite response regulator NarL